MKITDKRENTVELGSVKEGDVIMTGSGNVYMKIESICCTNNGEYVNVVNLLNGNPSYLSDHLKVHLIKCELIIE